MMYRDPGNVGDPAVSPVTIRGWEIFLGVILVLGAGFWGRPGLFVGDTVTSRMATVYALVHHHTWRIDRPADQPPNPFESQTVDKVMSQGRVISSKPPLIPLCMTALYLPFYAGGYTLDTPEHLKPILFFMVFFICQCPFLIGLVYFVQVLRWFIPSRLVIFIAFLFMAFLTPLFGYAQQLNNHTPAAAALMAAVYYGLGLYWGRLPFTSRYMMFFGFASALVCAMDLPVTIYPALLGLLLVIRFRGKAVLWGGIGAFFPLLIQVGATWMASGTPLPVQMRESTYVFESSFWRHPLGIDGLNEPRLMYLFHITFGRFGLFLMFPVVFCGLVYGLYLLFRREIGTSNRWLLGLGLGAFMILTAYYLKSTNNYGGAAYGFRWYIGSIPILMLLTSLALFRVRNAVFWCFLFVCIVVSAYSSWECLQAPWGESHEWTCRWIFGPAA